MKKDLLHFVQWKNIPEEQIEPVLDDLVRWGVKNIVAHPGWFREDSSYVCKMAARLKQYGIRSDACHALWGDGNDCIIPDPGTWNEMIRRHSLFLRDLTRLGVTTYTIHLGWHVDRPADWNFALLRKTVDALLPVCQETSIALALENSAEPFEIIEKLSAMVREYDSEYLGMCFDSGHANCYQKNLAGTLEVMRDGIITCHLHDNYGQHDDHEVPGQGCIDWVELDRLLDTLPRLHHAETESGNWSEAAWRQFCSVLKNTGTAR